MEITYCVMCCGEYPHVGDDFLCERCDNPASSGIIERDVQIENLAYENKMMTKKLEELGFTQEQISNICTGGTEEKPKLWTPYIRELEDKEETSFIDGENLVHIFEGVANEGYNVHVFKIGDIATEMMCLYTDAVLCTGTATDAVIFLS